MATPKQDAILRTLAKHIDKKLKPVYGERMGFALLVFPFGEGGISDYISNSERSCMIETLRETADRLEQRQDIPASISPIQ